MNARRWRKLVVCAVGCTLLSAANAQSSLQSTTTASAATTSHILRGRVLNALDGAVIPRALVTAGTRAVMTDPQGRFEFPEFTGTLAYLLVRKPGFSVNPDNPNTYTPTRLTDLDTPVDVKLYPDAIISGIVATPDGTALSRVSVTLRRRVFDQTGPHWQVVKTSQTNSRGEYRFRETAGKFQISTQYVVRSPEIGEAVLPKTAPEHGAGDEDGAIAIASGQQKRLDLRPRTSPTFPVPIQIEPAESQRGIQFTAKTASGESFNTQGRFDASAGVDTLTLPTGTFTLTARSGNTDRGRGDAGLTGTLKVTVSAHGSEGGILHLTPLATLPVEIALDPLATQSTGATSSSSTPTPTPATPNPQQLNLRLHNLDETDSMFSSQDFSLQQVDGGKYEFHLGPGRYRLMSYGGTQWYIESATYGVVSVITNDIVIAPGSTGGTPIRLVLNNTMGTVRGTVNLPAGAQGWVYLVPRIPAITPLNPYGLFASTTGLAGFTARLPVGSYTPVALDHQATEDLRVPEILAKYSTGGKTVDVTASATTTVALDLALEKTK